MPTPVFADTYEVRLHWAYADGVDGYNVLHAKKGGVTLTQAECDSIAAVVTGALSASNLLSSLSTYTQLVDVRVTDVSTLTGPQFTTGTAVSGTATGVPMPNEVAIASTLKTALRGRSYRGRAYLSGFAMSQNAGNAPITTCLSKIDTFWDDMIGDFITATHDLVIASRLHLTTQAVVSTVTNQGWDTQRRRKPSGS